LVLTARLKVRSAAAAKNKYPWKNATDIIHAVSSTAAKNK
jgi:hypothetical protein